MSTIKFTKSIAPATPATDKSIIYVDVVDNHLKQKTDTGEIYDLTTGGGELTHGFSVDNGVDVVTAGVKGYFVMPYDYLITGWSAVGNKIGSCIIDIWVTVDGIPTILDSITGTAKPTLDNDQYLMSTTLTDWDTHIAAGSIAAYYIEDCSGFNQLSFQLNVVRT